MVEFGGDAEATSNLAAAPIPAIAGMTHYHYDLDHNLIAESLSNGKVQREYIYLPSNIVVAADSIDMSAASALPIAHLNNTNNGSSTNETLYIINDHLRTPTKLTSSTKAVVWDRFQTPFGENASLTGTKETNLRLPGQYFDFESNYHYNLMRDYDAKLGRYIQSDPIGLSGGMNRYGYALANPIKYIDLLGLATYSCKKPLNVLGGKGDRSGPDIAGNPLYHQFLCVKNSSGKTVCGGQDRNATGSTGLGLSVPGKPSNDNWPSSSDKGSCEKKDDRECMDQCVTKRISDSKRPSYGIPFGTDCQEWANDVLNQCMKVCGAK